MDEKKKLGEILLEAGVIDKFQLKSALAEQNKWGGRLGNHLVQMGILTEELLVKALSKQLKIPNLDLQQMAITPDVLALVPQELAEKFHLVPVAVKKIANKKTLIVAMSDPTNLDAVDELQFRTGHIIKPAVAGDTAIEMAIRRYYYGEEPAPREPIPFGDPNAQIAPQVPSSDVQVPPEQTWEEPTQAPDAPEMSLADLAPEAAPAEAQAWEGGEAAAQPYDPQAYADPNAAPAEYAEATAPPADAPYADPNAQPYDAQYADPNAQPYDAQYADPNAQPYDAQYADPNAQAPEYADPNAVPAEYDPNAAAPAEYAEAAPAGEWDPNAQPYDAGYSDPGAAPAEYDPNAQPYDAGYVDPNAAPAEFDPNAQPYDAPTETTATDESWAGAPATESALDTSAGYEGAAAEAAPYDPAGYEAAPEGAGYEAATAETGGFESAPAWSPEEASAEAPTEAPADGYGDVAAEPGTVAPAEEPAQPEFQAAPEPSIAGETSLPPTEPVEPGPAEAAVSAIESVPPTWTPGEAVHTALADDAGYEPTMPGEPTYADDDAAALAAAGDAPQAEAADGGEPAVDLDHASGNGAAHEDAPASVDPLSLIPDTDEGRAVRAICGLLLDKGLLTPDELEARLRAVRGGS